MEASVYDSALLSGVANEYPNVRNLDILNAINREADAAILNALAGAPLYREVGYLSDALVTDLLQSRGWGDDGCTYGMGGPFLPQAQKPADGSNGPWRKHLGIWWVRHPAVPGAQTSKCTCYIWRKDAVEFISAPLPSSEGYAKRSATLIRPDNALRIQYDELADRA